MCRRIILTLISLVMLWPAIARGQGLNPLPLIIQAESSGNPTAQSNSSTSSGLAGEINATWATALQACGGACGTTAQYPTAASAPASVQVAATNALINKNGLSDWLCPNCDAPFAAQVAAAGGPGAFQTSGLDTNPANFSALDDSAGLNSFLASGGTPLSSGGLGTGTVFADGSMLSAGSSPISPPAASPSASSLPFQWVYNTVINGIMGQVDTSIQTVESLVSGPATTVLALAIAIMGIMTLFGNMDMTVFISFAIRAAIVMAFIQVGNTYYSQWIEGFVLGLPDYFANAFSLTGSGGSPSQLFDGAMNGWVADALSVWHSAPWTFKAIFIGLILALTTILIVIPSLVAMFTVWMISTFLLLVMLTIGPLMILALLFRTTHRFLHGYVNVMVTGIIFALVVDIVLGIFSSILTQVMGMFTPTGSPDTDLPGIFGIAVTMLITGLSMGRLPRMVEAIGGGVAVSMDTAGRFVAGGFAADAAGAAAGAASRVL